jgi:TRAP-type C4-dicarboxylate transport system substrate-binding protein
MGWKKLITLILTATMVLFLLGGPAGAETFRLTFGSVYPLKAGIWNTLTKDYLAAEISKRVAEKTDHEVKWNYAYAGAVAKHGEVLEAVQKGLLDVGMITTPFEPAKLFLHSLGYYVPFASVDTVLINKITNQLYNEVPYLKEVYEKEYNQKLLAPMVIDSYHVITKFPWQKMADFQGHKIAGAGANLEWIKACGAVPVQSNLAEAYTSLQTGVYEGWIMIVDATLAYKLYEPAPYYTFCDFGANPAGNITINLKKFNSMPKEVQEIILQVAKEYSEEVAKGLLQVRERNIQKMKDLKINLSTVPWDQKVAWAQAMPDQPNQRAKEAESKGMPGIKVMGRYIELMEKGGHKFPRAWKIEGYSGL